MKISVQGGRTAPTVARDALKGLSAYLPAATVEDIRLLVSELVTNSVRHGGADGDERIELNIRWDDRRVRVDVADPGSGFAAPSSPDAGPVSGWGLVLVDRIAERWGVETSGRTHVWFELEPDAQLQLSA